MKIEKNLRWADFQKLDMRIGTVLRAEVFKEVRIPALKLEIDFGELGVMKSSAQITELHAPEELIGKQIMAVVNFPPKQIANMMSECLVLGAVDNNVGISVLSPNHKVANGTRIS